MLFISNHREEIKTLVAKIITANREIVIEACLQYLSLWDVKPTLRLASQVLDSMASIVGAT